MNKKLKYAIAARLLFTFTFSFALGFFCLAPDKVEAASPDRFARIATDGLLSVVVDKETGVQYMIYKGSRCVDIQMMVDKDGNPLIYKEK